MSNPAIEQPDIIARIIAWNGKDVPSLTESEIRVMRDYVYGIPSTDSNWNGCKEGWMKPGGIRALMDVIQCTDANRIVGVKS